MNVYRVDYCTADNGWVCCWRATQAEAKKTQRDLEKVHGATNVAAFRHIDIPTAKPQLVEWLNINATVPPEED